ncbi:MAG TPA: GDSL-type esterase/lipase family protein [Acidimicrobiales bacterium]|nr:GDSL-type esterase/lipase family protein [Acidimicrobiales bacterium]
MSILAYLAACGAFVLLRGDSLFLSVLAIFAVGLLAIRLHRVVRRQFERADVDARLRWSLIGAVTVAGLCLMSTRIVGEHDGFRFFGLALFYLGVGLALAELRGWKKYPRRAFALVLAGCAALIVAGLAAAALGVEWAWWAVLLGLATAPIGIALVSEIALRGLASWRPKGSAVLGACGLTLLAVGVGIVGSLGVNVVYLAVGAGLLVVLMVGIAARTNVDVVFVIAAAAVVWTLGQRGVAEPETLHPGPDDQVVVALGDSFISGEGADEFYEGTNTPGQSTCRRAPTAYAPLLILERSVDVPSRLAFLACSGAKTAQVVGPEVTGATQVGQLLDQLGPVDDDIAFVLVSVGGNDALFGTVSRACLLPIDCTGLAPAFRDSLATVGETLDTAYADLRKQIPGVPVLVVPYPIPIARERCDSSVFSADEHRFLHDFARGLDQTVAASAKRAGFQVVDTMPGALDGLQLCADRAEGAGDVGVNFLAANSVSGTIEQSLNPTNWVHNSLHPNARGHEAMRSALVAWLDRHRDLRPPGAMEDIPPRVAPAAVTGSPCRGQTGDALDDCATDWTARETARYLLTRGWLGLPALVGAWLVGLQLVRLWSAIFDDRPPPKHEDDAELTVVPAAVPEPV